MKIETIILNKSESCERRIETLELLSQASETFLIFPKKPLYPSNYVVKI